MPLEQPNLDDRSYPDLVEEARRLIPSYDPSWTNHNPSDPGITLVELFAYLADLLIYRLNRVTDATLLKFLQLLNDPGWQHGPDLTADTRETVQGIRARFRAVTSTDFEHLALEDFNGFLLAMRRVESAGGALDEWWATTLLDPKVADNRPSRVSRIGRARCLAGRNLDRGTEAERTVPDPGHVSLLVVPMSEPPGADSALPTELVVDPFQPADALVAALAGFLDERRILTTRLHVVGPSHVPIDADIVIARMSDTTESELAARVVGKLSSFFAPLLIVDGEAEGWPFGRDVFVSELIAALETVNGVDYVTDVMLSSACEAGDDRCVEGPPVWHAEGDLIGLSLAEHHLPMVVVDTDGDADPNPDPCAIRPRIRSAPSASFVEVRVVVILGPTNLDVAISKRKMKSTVRTFFHPCSAAPDKITDPEFGKLYEDEFLFTRLKAAILAELRATPAPALVLSLQADRSRIRSESGVPVSVGINAGEIVNWRVDATVIAS